MLASLWALFSFLSVCQRGNSKSCRGILVKFLEEWDLWLATAGKILAVLRITMRVHESLGRIFAVEGQDDFMKFADNLRICRPTLTQFLRGEKIRITIRIREFYPKKYDTGLLYWFTKISVGHRTFEVLQVLCCPLLGNSSLTSTSTSAAIHLTHRMKGRVRCLPLNTTILYRVSGKPVLCNGDLWLLQPLVGGGSWRLIIPRKVILSCRCNHALGIWNCGQTSGQMMENYIPLCLRWHLN